MALTKYEQETIINYNRGEREVSIYSADPVVIRKLDALCEEQPNVYRLEKEWKEMDSGEICGKSYILSDKRLIRFGKKREYTEEQREELRKRGQKLFAGKGKNTDA